MRGMITVATVSGVPDTGKLRLQIPVWFRDTWADLALLYLLLGEIWSSGGSTRDAPCVMIDFFS